MKKIFVSTCFIFGFIANAFYQRNLESNTLSNNPVTSTLTDNTITQSNGDAPANNQKAWGKFEDDDDDADDNNVNGSIKTNPSPAVAPAPTPTPTTTPVVIPVVNQGKYKNGTYTGTKADANYGIIQVQAIITNGKISDVKFLSYPKSKQHSVEVSNYAIPILKKEAITVQSENVDAVSGASYTSTAFIESLGGALAQAI